MKMVCLSLAVLGVLLVVPGMLQAEDVERCKIEGTWYGFNTAGEVFVQTIHRTGAKTYTAVAQGPMAAIPVFAFTTGAFNGFHGDLVRTGFNEYDATWLIIDRIDATYDFDADPYFGGAGCGAGWDLMALVVFGPVTMPTCDDWTTTYDLDFIVYSFGTDPFVAGCSMGNPFGSGQGFHQRLPRLP